MLWPLLWPQQQLLRHGLLCAHSSGWLVLLYKAVAAVRATLMWLCKLKLYNIAVLQRNALVQR